MYTSDEWQEFLDECDGEGDLDDFIEWLLAKGFADEEASRMAGILEAKAFHQMDIMLEAVNED